MTFRSDDNDDDVDEGEVEVELSPTTKVRALKATLAEVRPLPSRYF